MGDFLFCIEFNMTIPGKLAVNFNNQYQIIWQRQNHFDELLLRFKTGDIFSR